MEASRSIMLFSLLLLSLSLPSAMASAEKDTDKKYTEPPQKKTVVVVEGVVFCQSCAHFGTWSLSGAQPIANATVSVVCNNPKKQVTFYKAYQTNARGYFFAELTGFKMGNSILDHPLQACKVRLVSSPQKNCSLPSNINLGLYGAPLRYEKVLTGRNFEAALFAAGPLAFRPTNCLPTVHY